VSAPVFLKGDRVRYIGKPGSMEYRLQTQGGTVERAGARRVLVQWDLIARPRLYVPGNLERLESDRDARLRRTMDKGDHAAKVILDQIWRGLPLRSHERDIVGCACLYLEGERAPGGSVARWWGK
jgi:hypothetical protein